MQKSICKYKILESDTEKLKWNHWKELWFVNMSKKPLQKARNERFSPFFWLVPDQEATLTDNSLLVRERERNEMSEISVGGFIYSGKLIVWREETVSESVKVLTEWNVQERLQTRLKSDMAACGPTYPNRMHWTWILPMSLWGQLL